MVATDELLNQILLDLEAWKANLPTQLRFTGPDSSRIAGMCVAASFDAFTHSSRPALPPLRLREHDVLACLYANQLFVP